MKIKNKDIRMKKSRKILLSLSAVLLIFAVVSAIYLGDFYHADMERINNFAYENVVKTETDENGYLVFEPEEIQNGFIFYPGGKVKHTAYIPLMKALASKGTLGILVKMPFHLAVFDVNAADGLQENYPKIENWYIGGHSLGGSMAASYLSKHASAFDGLILLGSYSTADLSELDVTVLSIYGSEDFVLNKENYESNKRNLPSDFEEMIIVGGCHAYFGMYGAQDGDGTPGITNEEQISRTVETIQNFMKTLD